MIFWKRAFGSNLVDTVDPHVFNRSSSTDIGSDVAGIGPQRQKCPLARFLWIASIPSMWSTFGYWARGQTVVRVAIDIYIHECNDFQKPDTKRTEREDG